MKQLITGTLILLLAAVPVFGEVYSYRDASGALTYVDDPGKIPARFRASAARVGEMEPLNTMDGGAGKDSTSHRASGAKKKEKFSGTIELYITDWCPHCEDAVDYVTENGYPHVIYDIEKDSAARKRSEAYPGRGVPLIVIGDSNFRGFSARTLEYYLEQERSGR